jgi:hypothetical protein
MLRNTTLVLLALVSRVAPLRAQSEVAGAALGVAYGALSLAAIHHLVSRSDNAEVGSLVRVSAQTSRGVILLSGKIAAIRPDTLTLYAADSTRQSIARFDLQSVDVYRGDGRRWAEGWAIGLLSGGAIGAIGGYAAGDDHGNDFLNFTRGDKAAILGIVGAVTGSVVGTLVGTMVRDEHWDHADWLRGASSVSVMPLGGHAVAVGAHLHF